MSKKLTSGARRKRAPDSAAARVAALARKLLWTWSVDARRLFAALDPVQWEATNHNPLETLERCTAERRAELASDADFGALLETCERQLRGYLAGPTWFKRAHRSRGRRICVAYFCSEFGLHESMQQYAGGLGILAGDHLKSASDLGVPLVGVGLLYRSGYYRQRFRKDGSTQAVYPEYDFASMPLEDTGERIALPLGRRNLHARIWKLAVGRVPLYLLDTDCSENRPGERAITRRLYGGDAESRLRQQYLLGVGGMLALDAVAVRPTVFHLNEGHAAFCGLERLRRLVSRGRALDAAIEAVRGSTVFTTHTPVPAGHDRYSPRLVMKYLKPLADGLGIARDELLALGREDPNDKKQWLCMTVLALRLAARCNGVSKLHGQVSREMWKHIYHKKTSAGVPIGHVTNGVHSQTWLPAEIEPLYRKYLKPRWSSATPASDCWKNAERIPAAELWNAKAMLRKRFVSFVRTRLTEQAARRGGPCEEIAQASGSLDEGALTIGFARRFATYKRAPLIFRDRKRLAKILSDPRRPVQLVFAGKAHPADELGQAFVKKIHGYACSPEFRGRVVLLEDYDMHVGRMLTSGCDVWLNNPIRPMEASGTSGMKPPLSGGLNCSILDGWWPEGFNGRNGWAIGDGRTLNSRAAQDRYDAECIYQLLETELVPLFYNRDRAGVPRKWVRMMTASMKSVCAQFSAHRMVGEYVERFYLPAQRR